MSLKRLSLEEVESLSRDALTAAGASPAAAASVARSTRLAERDGIRSHGLLYVPIYAEHLRCGKVDGQALPILSQPRPAVVRVDAAHGFAHAGIDFGWRTWVDAAREHGLAAMTLHRSYNCGVLGHHAERLAEQGLIGLCFTHAPASIAPTGGQRPVIGMAASITSQDGARLPGSPCRTDAHRSRGSRATMPCWHWWCARRGRDDQANPCATTRPAPRSVRP
jgi:(2R)-3-sulfolactate dehydrogenase (NADP+)